MKNQWIKLDDCCVNSEYLEDIQILEMSPDYTKRYRIYLNTPTKAYIYEECKTKQEAQQILDKLFWWLNGN